MITFHKQYLRCSERLFQAKLQTVDFELSTEETRKSINTWVKNKTNGKVTNLFGKGTIDPSSVMVLVSAIYFKGQWKNKFEKRETVKAPFHISVGKSAVVDMMYQTGTFKLAFIKEPQMQVLELPYADNNLRMIILLPVGTANVNQNFLQIESKLSFRNLMEWTNRRKMKSQYVEVFLPRFKIEKNYEMRGHLKPLGLQDIFDESRADLSGIASGGRLYISKLMHKSFIEVTEEGSEATAATENDIVEKQLPESTVFRADHPFLFVIRKNGIILFTGKVSCP
ncbi:Serpin B11 [Lemmus lemmus]